MKKTIDNCEINYEIIGEGIPIICLHGYFVDSSLMKGCLEPTLVDISGFKRIYIDLVGMGETPSNAQITGSDDLLVLIISFIKEILADENFILMGESFGGYLSLAMIEHFQNRILGLFLICPCVIGNHEKRNLPPRTLLVNEKIDILAEEQDIYESFLDMAVISTSETWHRYYDEVWVGVKKANVEFLNRFDEKYTLAEEKRFSEINFSGPASILMGRQDHIVGYEDAIALRDNFTRGTFIILDKAGHNLQIEQPQFFSCCLINFLDNFV